MNISEKTHRRLISTVLWTPILVIPAVYLSLSLLGDPNFSKGDVWDYIQFILPFILLFFVHDLLLVRRLFLRNRVKAYICGTCCLLGLFSCWMYWRAFHDRASHPDNRPVTLMERPHDWQGTPPPPPPAKRSANHQPPGPLEAPGQPSKKGPNPVAWDVIIAILLVGSNLSVAIFAKYVHEKKLNAELESSKLQQELESLKAQLNPHFLMNALNNIHGIVEQDPPLAQTMLMEVSRLMRYVLYEGRQPLTSLRAESTFIETYINLMRRRYSDKKVSIHLSLPEAASLDQIQLPPLLFIVMLENAFKHGISYQQPAFIHTSIEVREDRIQFTCANSYFPDKEPAKEHGGIGLENLKKRLDLLFGTNYTLLIDKQAQTFHVMLSIPY